MSEQQEPLVRRSLDRGVVTLTLDSPANRNALSTRLVAELSEGLAQADGDKDVRAVVLTHTGSVFCAGADLKEVTGSDPASGPRNLVALMRTIVELGKPVVARINGHVRAGGLGLAGACDIAVSGPKSTFAFTEVKLGLAPAVISLPLLVRLDPRAASAWYLTGGVFDAHEAARIGLITYAAAEDDSLDAACDEYLDSMRKASPQGLAETKRLVTTDVLAAFDRYGDAMVETSSRLFGSAEAQEGMRAFLERRPPSWAQ
ncbi:enoyl-CoA hydratase family protein [Actinospica sp. MGRD01-02]|uniref:Enoyl-CoA hydratase family protein n=1 Tax=Actinospica acidithermotolerans TaxID=2828514 RepID=A0A941IJP4_9ACTN|nr:enoyl-CoA hydratase family protein [Actinospica acidithermotolerans]MBR7827308.1 enoyl-CoA hydratase family protein [Actinospica acidithermotolerans]